jgi:HlyD family secretion protein
MDVARPSNRRQRQIRRASWAVAGIVAIASVSFGLARLKPAAPTVEAATLWPDTVKRGPMVRQVRGLGTLVPEDIRWIPATTQARVERIVLRPGTTVTPSSVILELSNPELDQEGQDAALKLQSAEASLVNLRVQMQNELLQQKSAAAGIGSGAAAVAARCDAARGAPRHCAGAAGDTS